MSDAALVVAVGRYQRDALAEVYRRHAGTIFAMARRVARSSEIAEDVVQEVFLRLWRDPTKFDPARGSLRTYLLTEAHNRTVDLLRSEESRRRREDRDGQQQDVGRREDPEREVVDMVVADRVREALADLPTVEREAIELAYFGGHSYREVATMLGQPEGTVKSRIRAGLRRLRSGLPEGFAWTEA